MDYTNCPIPPRCRPIYVYSEESSFWSFPISRWAKEGWERDNTEFYKNAFDNDWKLLEDKLPKAINNDDKEKENIKIIMKPK